MPFEYHDVHSDFINLNATQLIHLESNSILVNDVDIVLVLKQLSNIEKMDETNIIKRISQLESNTNTLLQIQESVQTDISNIKNMIPSHVSILDNNNLHENVSNEIARINENILSHKSLFDEKIIEHRNILQEKVSTVELSLNQLTNNVKSYMETINTIHKKFKYVESNQVDIMSIITRVITLEKSNKELIHTNEALHKIIDANNDKIDKLSVLVDNILHSVVNTNVEIPDVAEQSQPEQIQQISRAKSIVGKKNK
jgi:hypothetical protein